MLTMLCLGSSHLRALGRTESRRSRSSDSSAPRVANASGHLTPASTEFATTNLQGSSKCCQASIVSWSPEAVNHGMGYISQAARELLDAAVCKLKMNFQHALVRHLKAVGLPRRKITELPSSAYARLENRAASPTTTSNSASHSSNLEPTATRCNWSAIYPVVVARECIMDERTPWKFRNQRTFQWACAVAIRTPNMVKRPTTRGHQSKRRGGTPN